MLTPHSGDSADAPPRSSKGLVDGRSGGVEVGAELLYDLNRVCMRRRGGKFAQGVCRQETHVDREAFP